MRIVAAMLAIAAASLALVATAGAATIGVQIKSTGFSPSSISLNHGDQVTWKNTDKTDHQVVADDGSFASPILHAGQSYTRRSIARGPSATTTPTRRGTRARSR